MIRVKRLAGIGARVSVVALSGALVVTAAATSSASAATSSQQTQGITPTSVTVGSISTQTGPIAANFASLVYGEKAYFDWVNASGGINGRKIDYKYQLDDGGNPSSFNQLASTLIDQDKVFAVTGVATAFFTPNLFKESGIPTYGYNVTANWSGSPNLFAAGGSVLYYPSVSPDVAYLMKKTKSTSLGVVAYGIAASSGACNAAANSLRQNGYHVAYEDLNVAYPGSTVSVDVQKMKQDGVNMIMSCLDVTGNVSMARAVSQDGMKTGQFWLNGNDQGTLDKYSSIMQHIYFYIEHVPFAAPTKYYPGLATYLKVMNKYEPKYTDDEVAMQGWQSAALFAQGLALAGKNPTWSSIISATNNLTQFTAAATVSASVNPKNGVTTPVDWKTYGHVNVSPTSCLAYIQVQGTKFVPVFGKGHQVFLCFKGSSVKNPVPITPLSGTPGT